MTELITYIARALVDKPEQVELRETAAEAGKVYELKVAAEDIGKVIGRDGRTVNAMRTLLAAAAQRKGERARLEILDDRRGERQAPQPPPPNAAG
ncbi:MAG: KH domain-containing protein [Myxococcales bacterium]|nr:KH domain-containing protein [Myxococcales bacterium]